MTVIQMLLDLMICMLTPDRDKLILVLKAIAVKQRTFNAQGFRQLQLLSLPYLWSAKVVLIQEELG